MLYIVEIPREGAPHVWTAHDELHATQLVRENAAKAGDAFDYDINTYNDAVEYLRDVNRAAKVFRSTSTAQCAVNLDVEWRQYQGAAARAALRRALEAHNV